MTTATDLAESYQRSWFPPGLGKAEYAQRAEMMRLAALSMPRPKSLTASQHAERRTALLTAAEAYRNPDLLRRVAAGHRPAEFRARTNPYQAAMGRVFDGVLIRQARAARADLWTMLQAADRAEMAEAARLTAALDRRVGAALTAALDRRITADRERRARLKPTGPIRVF